MVLKTSQEFILLNLLLQPKVYFNITFIKIKLFNVSLRKKKLSKKAQSIEKIIANYPQ